MNETPSGPAQYSCEDLLPPVYGIAHFCAALTSLPLMIIPFWAIRKSLLCPRDLRVEVVCWSLSFLGLFITNLCLHVFGGRAAENHENQAQVHNVAAWYLLNSVRLREQRAAITRRLSTFIAIAAITVLYSAMAWHPSWEKTAVSIVAGLFSPVVLYWLWSMSYSDEVGWGVFLRSSGGMVLLLSAAAVEPYTCTSDITGRLFHAVIEHGLVVVALGCWAQLMLHLCARCPLLEKRKGL
ncbi:unnamed protein product [Heterosigma akashiwo]|mmetsp:Transcript_11018/g.17243  ORF Transcript_11018/g.17243 Transcript_11018/m.17243 type:complete len:239 (+) Transcript_11018:51-767(+)